MVDFVIVSRVFGSHGEFRRGGVRVGKSGQSRRRR